MVSSSIPCGSKGLCVDRLAVFIQIKTSIMTLPGSVRNIDITLHSNMTAYFLLS